MTKKQFFFFLLIFIINNSFCYLARAEVLECGGKECYVNIEDPNTPYYPEIIKRFSTVLSKYTFITGKLKECEKVIDIPVGTAHGNHSYGGICTLEKGNEKIKVMICADMMAGHEVIEFSRINFNETDLSEFVAHNCYGG